MKKTLFASVLAASMLVAAPLSQAAMDYNLVGKVAALLLRNVHFNKQPFDEKLSARLLDEYLTYLDFRKVYFLQSDVDALHKQYGDNLARQVQDANCMGPAKEIFSLYMKRVEERHAWAEKFIRSSNFTFDSNNTVEIARDKAAWPKDQEDADRIWAATIEDSLLRERIRADEAKEKEAKAKEKDKDKPGATAKAAKPEEDPKEKILKRYKRVMENFRESNDEEICDYFLAALSAVYDPHTEYFSHSEEEQFQTSMRNSLTGIGAQLQADDEGTTQIKGIIVGGPVDKQGLLHLEDRIIAVDPKNSGEMVDIMYMKINKVVELIRGPVGTEVRLKVNPADDPSATKEVVITREKVELKDQLATAQLIRRTAADGAHTTIGWLDIPSFYADLEGGTTGVTRDVKRLLRRLMDEGIDGLVIDLRGNGGGALDEAVNLSGLFIPSGPVVQAKDSLGNIKVLDSEAPNAFYSGPLVVLTDKTSASASEIFAAALQDYHRAVIVGEKSTFGKGTVQNVTPIAKSMPVFADTERAGSLKVTIQKFYRIAGSSTQLLGVIPDVILPSRFEALKIGEEALKNPLPHDNIRSLDFKALDVASLHTPELAKHSQDRIANDPEFNYIREDVARLKEQIERNTLTLNLAARKAEVEDNKTRNKERNAERKTRFARVQAAEGKSTEVFKLTLDNVADKALHPQSEFPDEDNMGMRRSKDSDGDGEEDDVADEAPKPPFGFDPIKREALLVTTDLIGLAGAKKPETVRVP